jgi:hypothetical protein
MPLDVELSLPGQDAQRACCSDPGSRNSDRSRGLANFLAAFGRQTERVVVDLYQFLTSLGSEVPRASDNPSDNGLRFRRTGRDVFRRHPGPGLPQPAPARRPLETASVRRLSAAGWQDIPMAVEFRTWMSGVGGRRPRACHDASAGPRGHAGVMTAAVAASLQLTARGGGIRVPHWRSGAVSRRDQRAGSGLIR